MIMVKFRKRTRKLRGSRTVGYGKIGQHRGKGQRVGKGKTTHWKKSLWSYYQKQKKLGFPDPDWIKGSIGFHRPPDMVRLYRVNAINVKDLDNRIDLYVQENKASKSGNSYSINLGEINIQKLLGRGDISKPINISVKKASERAVQKIEAAGGKVTLLSSAE
jgi:large subunit ribosomal protein L15